MKWSDSGGEFTPPPPGTHVARCIRIIDLGTQTSEYQGQPNVRRQCLIGWELPTELMEHGDHAGKPFVVSKFYTASLSEKANLRKDLETWRGKAFTAVELEGFDSKNVLGKPCLVTVVIGDKKKTKVTSVTSVPKGMQVPAQVNPSVLFSLEEFDQAGFDALSDGIKKIIAKSPEYQALIKRANGVGDPYDADWKPGDEPAPEDEVPF